MTISNKIQTMLARSSWIRKMFEEGASLKKIHGERNVFDFSLGNPRLKPPEEFQNMLQKLASSPDLDHGYMPNAGYPYVRQAVADSLTEEHQIKITAQDVIMTCGAGGALNVILKTILNQGDEVITPAPYFVEYTFYTDNHGGILKTVPTKPDFNLDLSAISSAITEKTKAVLINSPNNPTGQVYSEESINELEALLNKQRREKGRLIYLIADEPYRKIVYDDILVPSIFTGYNESILVHSHSKDISIPGERIGFLAINPRATHREHLVNGMTFANRILGFVNAPALMQRAVASLQDISVDISTYAHKRELLCNGLAESGYDFIKPKGAFYLFPKTPIPDDNEFVRSLHDELIIVVPGSGFSCPGHFRIAFCVDDETIINALPGFKRVMEKWT